MNLHDYTLWTDKTAFYPGKGTGNDTELLYLALGLAGETGEIVEKTKKQLRDGTHNLLDMKYELGDCLWYWVRLCRATGVNLGEIQATYFAHEALAEVPNFTASLALGLAYYAGLAANSINTKVLEGNYIPGFSPSSFLAQYYSIWEVNCQARGFLVHDVIIANVVKLENRLARKTLHGSGDNR